MRLYEFADPQDYTLPTDDSKDSTRQVEQNCKPDDAVPHPKQKPQTKQMKPLGKR